MFRVAVLNSLDDRYGSTYRIRAFARLLKDNGLDIRYLEGAGSPFKRLLAAIGLALGQYDLFVAQKFNPITIPAMVLARIRGKPVIVDWDDIDLGLQGNWWKKVIAYVSEAIGPRLASHITTHSRTIYEMAKKKNKPTTIVQQGYEESVFGPDTRSRKECRVEYKYKDDDIVIGYLCTLTDGGAMDLPIILQSWKEIKNPQFKFLIIGGGPLESNIKKQIFDLGLDSRVIVTGILPQKDVARLLNAMDVGVVYMSDRLANRARASFKIIEYLATNVPVVGQLIGETETRFGDLIHVCTKDELAAKTVEIGKLKKRKDTRSYVKKYQWDTIADTLMGAIKSVSPGSQECH